MLIFILDLNFDFRNHSICAIVNIRKEQVYGKEKWSLGIIIALMAVVILGLGGYLVYNKIHSKTTDNKIEETINSKKTYDTIGNLVKNLMNKYSNITKKDIGIIVSDKEYIYLKLYEYLPSGSPGITLVIANTDGKELFKEVIKERGQSIEIEEKDSCAKFYANDNYYMSIDSVYYLSNGFSCTNEIAKEYKITVNNDEVTKTEIGTHNIVVSGSCS